MRRLLAPSVTLTLLLLTALCLTGGIARCAEVFLEEDITYGRAGDTELKLDLARPQGDETFPAIVFIHGGGWYQGNRQGYRGQIQEAARRGYVATTISYRLMQFDESKKETTTATPIFPAQIHDAKAATFVGAMVSVNDFATRPAHIVNNDDVLTTGKYRYRLVHTPHLPHAWDAGMLFEECSPITHLTKDDPPAQLFYGMSMDAADIHSPRFGKALKEKMDALGIRCEVYAVHEVLGGGEKISTIDFVKEAFGMK